MNRFVALAPCALVLAASQAWAQLVVGNDQPAASNPTLWLIDLSGSNSPRALASGSILVGDDRVDAGVAWGAAADESGRMLYWNNNSVLFAARYTSSGMLAASGIRMTLEGTNPPVAVGFTGLAFDTVDHGLYGFKNLNTTANAVFYPIGIYRIDPATGGSVLVLATPGADFGGFDFDSTSDAFYALNDLTTGPGQGLIRFDKPLASGSTHLVARYPSGEFDIDGLAMGGGRAYFVNDTPLQSIYVYDMSAGMFESPISSPFTATGALFAAGAWAPGLMVEPPRCGTSDFNGDGDFGTDADIEAFFACLAGNCCPSCFVGGADFNMDGDTGTDADIEVFFRVLAGSPC